VRADESRRLPTPRKDAKKADDGRVSACSESLESLQFGAAFSLKAQGIYRVAVHQHSQLRKRLIRREYVSTIIRTTATALSTTAELERTLIRLIRRKW
jgi:hypothetical protein